MFKVCVEIERKLMACYRVFACSCNSHFRSLCYRKPQKLAAANFNFEDFRFAEILGHLLLAHAKTNQTLQKIPVFKKPDFLEK